MKTHTIVRFKIPVEDAENLAERINRVKSVQGFTEEDNLSNDGNALIHILEGDSDE